MEKTSPRILHILFLLPLFCGVAYGQLSTTFYDSSCPHLVEIVREVVGRAVANEPRMAASLLRLHFHDCFVQGCDGSLLLDDVSGFVGEKTAVPNQNSARGFDVIDNIKTAVEYRCPNVVSCADILILAAREATLALRGPFWPVVLGRRDSTTASLNLANNDIPPPTSTFSQLLSKYQAKGLSAQDLIVTSGAHTIGQARCLNFRDRLYNFSGSARPDPNLNSFYLFKLQQQCGQTSASDNNLSPLDEKTPYLFDNAFFINLQLNKVLLNSDQVLSSQALVNVYAADNQRFFSDFAAAMVNMGNINPLTGSSGEIRKNCRARN